MSPSFAERLDAWRRRVEREMDAWLPPESASPGRLHAAQRYSALGPGKRIRPALVYATAETLGVPLERVDGAACAVELIHAYSLIHDDLPAMDDDDLRRGMPTVHKKFNEAAALLAGDTLLTFAFEKIAAAVIGGREIEKELGTELKAVVAAADKHSKNVESGEDADAKKAARALQRAVGNMAKLLVGGPVAVTSYATRTASAALNYCEKSLAQYK